MQLQNSTGSDYMTTSGIYVVNLLRPISSYHTPQHEPQLHWNVNICQESGLVGWVLLHIHVPLLVGFVPER